MITYHAIRRPDRIVVSVYNTDDNSLLGFLPGDHVEWGYCGRGPNTLAQHILADYCQRTGRTYDLMDIHDFLYDIIAQIHDDEFVLPGDILNSYTKEVNHA